MLELAARAYIRYAADEGRFFRYASVNQVMARYGNMNHSKFKHSPHRYLGHYPTPNYADAKDRHNALGFRGEEIVLPKPDGEFRIVCLGGSTTYTSWVRDYRLTYPALLQDALVLRGYDVTVVNAGNEAWTSYETLINMAFRVIDLEPDMIIVYHGVNDIVARFVWPPDAYRGDNSGFRGPNVPELAMPNILEHSSFIRAFLVKSGAIAPHASLFRTYDRHAPTYRSFTRQENARGSGSSVFDEVSGRLMLETNSPRYFERNLESTVALANYFDIVPVLATFAYCPGFEEEPLVNSEEILWAYDESNDVVRRVATKSGARLFDFAEVFPRDKSLFADGIHVTNEGARIKAELFADFLDDSGLLPG